ncbi:MAG: type II toxin-antitoxin system VapC family toxin [Rhodothermia bacterium]
MIVVDADVIAAFWIKTTRTPCAIEARRRDPDWVAPVLWRSEFRSILRQYLVADHMTHSDAVWIAEKAERTMRGKEYAVESASVLKLVGRTSHSSYDREYVALAEDLGLSLVTGDRKLARLFPNVAILLEDFEVR